MLKFWKWPIRFVASIAQALIAAHQKGLKVEVIVDKSGRQEGYSSVVRMLNAGIPFYLDGMHAVMNNRVIIIDKKRRQAALSV